MNAATGAAGGFLIPSEMMATLIPQLREVSQARRLGITVIDGLQGEVFWNKSKGGITAEHLNTEAEATGSESVATFDQIKLSPRPIASFVPLSFQMRNQPAMALESWVMSEIATAIGLLEDQSIFIGDGSNGAPRGVLNHPSINSVTFAGTVYTAAGQTLTDKLMDVVKTCRKKFALGLGNLGWATSPDVLYHFGKVKDAQRRPIFASLTEGNAATQGAPPTMMRYPVVDTEFLDQGAGGTVETLLFGPWKDVVLGHWGTLGLAMSEETETNFRKGRTTLRGIWQYDVGVFHGDAFVTAHAAGAGTIDTTASVA
jgi:HK97 family phage major capsid protein